MNKGYAIYCDNINLITMKYKTFYIIWLIILLSGIIACKNNTVQSGIVKNGKTYGITKGLFRHNWWNYYERACSFMDGEFYPQAEMDFRQAISRREHDQLRTRTYGFHFIDYFPHRELGIALFYQQNYQESIHELEKSIASEKSARGCYYIDKARNHFILQQKSDKDTPQIFISTPEPDMITNSTIIHVKGHTTDDTYVKEIWINKTPIRVDVAAQSIYFDKRINIQSGTTIIDIIVIDIVGKQSIQQIQITCDLAGPVLNMNEISSQGINTFLIDGFAYDNSGIKEIKINDQNIIKQIEYQHAWKHKCVTTDHTIRISAIDKVGNKTIANLNLPFDHQLNLQPFHNKLLLASMKDLPIIPKHITQNCHEPMHTPFIIETHDKRGSKINVSQNPPIHGPGNYYALIIGINAYHHWRHLKTAVNDAIELKHLLIQKYSFLESNVALITDQEATRKTLVHTIRRIAGGLGEHDNLLIYFAGHGKLDDLTSNGYWIPIDGAVDDLCTWITHSTIKDILSSEKVLGKNIMVIADSCYSGNLLRGGINSYDTTGRLYEKKLLQLAQKKSRQIIASGGMEQVADWGKDNHSLFAYYLLQALRENQQPVIDLENLINTKVFENVSKIGGQRPIVGRFKTQMDEDGQFVLLLKDSLPKESVSEQPTMSQINTDSTSTRSINLPDTVPPTISIKGWDKKQLEQERVVFLERVYIDGNALDEEGIIQQLTINDKSLIKYPTHDVYFNTVEDLKPGMNKFKIVCTDHVGNQTEQEILINRNVQKVFDIGSHMSIILFPFVLKEPYNINMYDIILSKLIESKRFNIIYVSQDMINLDSNKERKIASQLKADMYFKPEIEIKENKNSLELKLKVIITPTNEYISIIDVYGEQINKQLIETLSEGIHLKILDEFPLIKGKVIEYKDNEAIIDLCEKDHIKKGMQVIFYKEDKPLIDPDTGEFLGSDVIELATGLVNKVLKGQSHANLLNPIKSNQLNPGVEIVTK